MSSAADVVGEIRAREGTAIAGRRDEIKSSCVGRGGRAIRPEIQSTYQAIQITIETDIAGVLPAARILPGDQNLAVRDNSGNGIVVCVLPRWYVADADLGTERSDDPE